MSESNLFRSPIRHPPELPRNWALKLGAEMRKAGRAHSSAPQLADAATLQSRASRGSTAQGRGILSVAATALPRPRASGLKRHPSLLEEVNPMVEDPKPDCCSLQPSAVVAPSLDADFSAETVGDETQE